VTVESWRTGVEEWVWRSPKAQDKNDAAERSQAKSQLVEARQAN